MKHNVWHAKHTQQVFFHVSLFLLKPLSLLNLSAHTSSHKAPALKYPWKPEASECFSYIWFIIY